MVKNRGGDAACALLVLFVVQRVAPLACLAQRLAQHRGRGHRLCGAWRQYWRQMRRPVLLGLERQHRLAERSRVDRVAATQLRLHPQRAPALDNLQVDDLRSVEHTQVYSLVEAITQLTHRRKGDLADPQRRMNRLPQLPDPQPDSVEVGNRVVRDEAAGTERL